MSPGRSSGKPRARFQRGFAFIAVLVLAALIAAFLISSALNRTSADVANERDQRTMDALKQAKAALIAYAASEQWQSYKGQTADQPGGLPCPDVNNTGSSPGICSGVNQRLGRLPYLTIGSDDLRDASGERLWYAVSSNFYKKSGVGGNVINSDTPGLLTVTGSAPANNVVAVVLAPGQPIQDWTLPGQLQDRSPANINRPASYLERFAAVGADYSFDPIIPLNDKFNDRLLVITQADLMAAVEPVVAARIGRDINPLIQSYYTKWGDYPFPMTFMSPPASTTSYKGTPNQTKGWLPLTNDPNFYTWGNITITQIGGWPGGSPTVTGWNCSINSSPPFQASCRIDYCCNSDDRPDIMIQIPLLNANAAFADIPSPIALPANMTMLDHNGNPLSNQGPPYGQWSAVGPLVPTETFSTQTATIVYKGRLQNAADTNQRVFVTIPLPTPAYLPVVSSDPVVNPSGAWFIANQWYTQTYYAVSAGYISGGDPTTCNSPTKTSCLTVNNIPAPSDDKRVILVLAGRALTGVQRPTGSPADYFEGVNLTAVNTSSLIFETRVGAPTTKNDRVVIISP